MLHNQLHSFMHAFCRIDKILSAKSTSSMESIKFSLEIFNVVILDPEVSSKYFVLILFHFKLNVLNDQGDCYIEVNQLTDEIVGDMISRIVNCADRVQTVFLEQGLVFNMQPCMISLTQQVFKP